MKFYEEYSKEIEIVFDYCRDRIKRYPNAYKKRGLEYLDKLNPAKAYKGSYISFMLPFWLKDPFNIDNEIIRRLSMAGVFKMLCASIQDKIIDSSESQKYTRLLPLANLFFIEFNRIYQEIFPGDSIFWSYFGKYFNDYAESIDDEKNRYESNDLERVNSDLTIMAKKSAPVKLSVCAVCLISKKKECIPNLERQVDYVLITLQLLDDWVDKYRDYEERSFTYVLSEIMKFNRIDDFTLLKKTHINKAAYFSDIPQKIDIISKRHKLYLSEPTEIEIPGLFLFHENLMKEITDIIINISEKKKSIIQGGFYNMLQNS